MWYLSMWVLFSNVFQPTDVSSLGSDWNFLTHPPSRSLNIEFFSLYIGNLFFHWKLKKKKNFTAHWNFFHCTLDFFHCTLKIFFSSLRNEFFHSKLKIFLVFLQNISKFYWNFSLTQSSQSLLSEIFIVLTQPPLHTENLFICFPLKHIKVCLKVSYSTTQTELIFFSFQKSVLNLYIFSFLVLF